MLKAYVCRVAAGAVFSAAVAVGSLGLTAAAASACTGAAACAGGPRPAAAATCTDPDCTRGVPPVAAHAGNSTAINCPPPNPEVTAPTGGISDC